MARTQDLIRFPKLADWLRHEEHRNNFIEWLDAVLGIEGNWMRDSQLGLELRVEMYFEYLIEKQRWQLESAEKDRERLREYIKQFADRRDGQEA